MAKRVVTLEQRDPPPKRRRGGASYGTVQRDWETVAEFLRCHPDTWYVIERGYKCSVSSAGRPMALRRPMIEITNRGEADGSRTTYARWITGRQ